MDSIGLKTAGKDEEGVEFVAGEMVPTFPFERRDGDLVLRIYDQDGTLRDLPTRDCRDNEIFGVWLRRFDRYTPKTA
jgi:hypothetical protein